MAVIVGAALVTGAGCMRSPLLLPQAATTSVVAASSTSLAVFVSCDGISVASRARQRRRQIRKRRVEIGSRYGRTVGERYVAHGRVRRCAEAEIHAVAADGQ